MHEPRRTAPGRPRDPKVDEAALRVTRELLAEVGYRRFTIDAVARRAGVSRTTLRLRWKSKAELVFDAVFPEIEELSVVDSGSLESDLRACASNAVRFFRSSSVGAAFQGLIEDCRHQPEIRATLLARVNEPTVLGYRAMIERAVERGEAELSTDPDVLLDIVAGAVLYRFSVSGLDLGRLEDQLVDILGAGIRRREAGGEPPGNGPPGPQVDGVPAHPRESGTSRHKSHDENTAPAARRPAASRTGA